MVAPRRRKLSPKERERIFLDNNGICHICTNPIDPIKEKWDADHVNPREITGKDDLDEFKPAHKKCHSVKTASDIKIIRKSQRIRRKHMGIKKEGGGFDKRYKRKMDGSVVDRLTGEVVRRTK
jgi:5-methylcytosine-specific restriction protein A